MSEPQIPTLVTVAEQARPLSTGLLHVVIGGLRRTIQWAANTAQQLAELLAALMGPAVVCAYAFTAWSLAQNVGWTNTFVFQSGPFSNFFIWLVIASLISLAAGILRRRTQIDKSA